MRPPLGVVMCGGVLLALAAPACKGGSPSASDAGAPTSANASAGPIGAAAAAADGGASAEVDAGFVSASAALEPGTSDAGALRGLEAPPRAGATIDVAAGAFPSGSTPGDEGRDPTLEPLLVEASLGAFAIDALPFPNDPAQPPKTGASLEEAARLCRERGARLCSELEWERACKGPDNDAFASGARWNPACEKEGARCASGFGVRAMGTLPELTDSRFASAESGEGASVVRGGAGAVTTRRCAARAKAGAAAEVGFRCCKGAANGARVAPIEARQAFKKAGLEPAQLAKIFAQVPELLRIGTDLRYFTEGDVRAIAARSGAAHDGITFMTSPILWSPESGAELLVAAGRGRSMSFVVALWALPGDRYRFASSFLMLNDLSPVVLAFDSAHRRELKWTSCWGCPGEQGSVSYRLEDHRVVIVQQ